MSIAHRVTEKRIEGVRNTKTINKETITSNLKVREEEIILKEEWANIKNNRRSYQNKEMKKVKTLLKVHMKC